jgi:2-hydroxy-3-keto-5-methylthiopentenyl-1-phosphate phosphatase
VSPPRDVSRPLPAGWSVLCDFDGTIAPVDVTDSLLQEFARPGWQELEAEWHAGRIGSRACMAQQVALLDCSRAELEAHLAGIEIDPAFGLFVAAVQAASAPLTIVSDGLDQVIFSMLGREGLAHVPVRASRLVQTGPRRWALEFPHARDDCRNASATCKCAWASVVPRQRVLMIGDGVSDFCAAAGAELTFARSRLLEHCLDLGLPCVPVRNFGEVLIAWRELTGRAPDPLPALAGEEGT